MIEKLPPEFPGSENLREIHAHAQYLLKENVEFESSSFRPSFESEQQNTPDIPASGSDSSNLQKQRLEENEEVSEPLPSIDGENGVQESISSYISSTGVSLPSLENSSRSPESYRPTREGETSIIEQFEHGVYVTLIVIPGGGKVFKRVRFRYES